VQEKKIKQVSVMTLDTSTVGNGATNRASTSTSVPLPNGGCSEKSDGLNGDLLFPPGGYPSLRLPVVIAPTLC
jgi:serine/threonine-protein phosphatase 2A regulatory subunit B